MQLFTHIYQLKLIPPTGTLKYQYTHKYNFYTIGNPEFNNAITMSDMNSYTQEHSMESFFGRVNYDFDNKYYLSASIL